MIIARPKGANCVAKGLYKATYDMYCIIVLLKDICAYYGLARKTLSAITLRLRNYDANKIVRKQVCPKKLSARGMRLFRKYVIEYCYEPLYVLVTQFSMYTGFYPGEGSGRRFIRILNMIFDFPIQKLYLS